MRDSMTPSINLQTRRSAAYSPYVPLDRLRCWPGSSAGLRQLSRSKMMALVRFSSKFKVRLNPEVHIPEPKERDAQDFIIWPLDIKRARLRPGDVELR